MSRSSAHLPRPPAQGSRREAVCRQRQLISGPQHIAAITNTPAVVLFGPSDPKLHLDNPNAIALFGFNCTLFPCGKNAAYGLQLSEGGMMHLGHGPLQIAPLPCAEKEVGICTKTIEPKEVLLSLTRLLSTKQHKSQPSPNTHR